MKRLILPLLLLMHLFLLVNLRFTAWPEMLSFPYLRNHGFVIYLDMVHVYPSLLIVILAFLYKIFGYKLLILQVFHWVTILANDLLIFVVIKKLTKGERWSLFGVFVYVLLQPFLEGNMVWPDVQIVMPLLAATLFLEKRKYFLAGVFLAIGTLIKQTGLGFVSVGGLWLLVQRKPRDIFKFTFGIILVTAPFILRLLSENAFLDFLNWTLIYPSKYWTTFPGYVRMIPSRHDFTVLILLFLPLGFLVWKVRKKVFKASSFWLIFGMFLIGVISVYPRFSFFHFQTALAFWVILLVVSLTKVKLNFLVLGSYLFVLLIIVARPVLALDWQREARFYTNDDLKLGEVVGQKSKGSERIFLLNLPSSLYVFGDKLPAKPWIDNFGWYFEVPGVQEDTIKRWESNPPNVIFWKETQGGAWYNLGVYEPKMVTDWIKVNYTKKEIIENNIGIWERE